MSARITSRPPRTRWGALTLLLSLAATPAVAAVGPYVRPTLPSDQDRPHFQLYHAPLAPHPATPAQSDLTLLDSHGLRAVIPSPDSPGRGGDRLYRIDRDGASLTITAYYLYNLMSTGTLWGPVDDVFDLGVLSAGTYTLTHRAYSYTEWGPRRDFAAFVADPMSYAPPSYSALPAVHFRENVMTFTVVPEPTGWAASASVVLLLHRANRRGWIR